MKIQSLIAIILLFCIGACTTCENDKQNTEKEQTTRHFPKEVNLTGTAFNLKDGLIRYPFRIRQCENYIYLMDLHGEDAFCHIFRDDNFQHVTSFAYRGEAPQMTLQAINLEVISPSNIWTYDKDKRILTHWSFNEHLDTVTCEAEIRIKEIMATSANMTMCNDTSFFLTDRKGENRIIKFNMKGEITQRIGHIPTNKKVPQSHRATLAQAWNSFIHYNPRNEILAIGTQLGDILEIYNLKKGTCKVIRGTLGEPIYKTAPTGFAVPTGIMGFSDIQVTDNYIYAVFHGRTFKEIAMDPKHTPDGGIYIQVYDIEGNPVCRYILDHAIYGIHVNEEKGIIWATDVNVEEQLVLYKIPPIESEK